MGYLYTQLPRWCNGKESASQYREFKRCGLNAWVRIIPWSRKWQPTPVFLPGKLHGQRSLAGHKESNMTEWLSKYTYIHIYIYWMLFIQIKRNEILPFATTWMDLEGATLSEISQTKMKVVHYHFKMWKLKNKWMYATKLKQTHSCRQQTSGYQWREGEVRKDKIGLGN